MKAKSKYHVIGLMSGTSLDGLDIVYCALNKKGNTWKFRILEATIIKYPSVWKQRLSDAHKLSAVELLALDVRYGKFLGEMSRRFIEKKNIERIDFLASHGHTIFHQPNLGFTYQLGSGLALHEVVHIPVVYDFRSLDVSRGGQGAPLVPIGDQYLFGQYDCCVNLGGIANLSMQVKTDRIAFDFCFANIALNYLMALMGKEFDKDGMEASRGEINRSLLKKLNALNQRWRKNRPSLGREFFEKYVQSWLDDESVSVNDKLRTCCESIAIEFDYALPVKKNLRVLVTGGGALNVFLMKCIKSKLSPRTKIVIPSRQILKFKEGLIFALLGVLRVRNEINSLKSVTGARTSSSGGVLIGFTKGHH